MTESLPSQPAEHIGTTPAAQQFVLGRRASYWVAAGVVAHTLWTSAAPAMTYPLYAAEWHLSHAVITAIFAIYPVAIVAILVGFGDLSDYIGRRATMLIGLAASLIGVLLFAAAPNVDWLYVGRAFMGIGVGLTAGPSTAAMVEFSEPHHLRLASAVTTAAQAVGFGLALVLGGALIEYAPFPMRLNFWVLFAVLLVLFAATWFMPRPAKGGVRPAWRPKLPFIPAELRRVFIISATAVTAAYTHGVMILSLGSQVAHDLVGSSNVLVNGAALSLFALSSGAIGIAGRRLSGRGAMVIGGVTATIAMALFATAVADHSLAVFLTATATAGVGYGLLLSGGLEMIRGATPSHHRGGVLSALYLGAYGSLGVVALALGQVATLYSLRLAIDLGAAWIAALALATVILTAVGVPSKTA